MLGAFRLFIFHVTRSERHVHFCSPSRVETCWKHQRVVEWYHFSLKKAEKVTWDNGTWPYHSSCRMVSWDIFRFENVNTGALEIFGSIRIQNAENRTRLFPIHVLFYIAPIFFKRRLAGHRIFSLTPNHLISKVLWLNPIYPQTWTMDDDERKQTMFSQQKHSCPKKHQCRNVF